jgi:hypothetical protein
MPPMTIYESSESRFWHGNEDTLVTKARDYLSEYRNIQDLGVLDRKVEGGTESRS